MGKRPHFGVYLSSVEEACQSGIWEGISQFASDFNVSLTVFISTYQQQVGFLRRHYEVTRDFAAHASELDGMLFLGGPVMDGLGNESAESYHDSFAHLPTVNISMLYGSTSLVVDNREGMRKIVEHLITEHGRKRIAFVKGPDGHREADERFIAYCDALRDAGISIDEALICDGSFTYKAGVQAVKTLIEDRHVSFDAVVAVDDETAMGVLEELSTRNFKVPEEVSVTGFDNIEMAEAYSPSITTIAQPFFNLGYSGARQLLERCIDHKDGGVTTLNPELIIRQSCGCIPSEVLHRPDANVDGLREVRATLAETLVKANVGVPIAIAEEWFDSLSSYLVQIPEGEERFLRDFDRVLSQYRKYSSDFSVWQQILTEFQITVTALFENNSERLIQIGSLILKSSWLIHGALRSEDKKLELDGTRTQWQIRGIAHSIMSAFDFNDLYSKVESGFRELGIGSAIVGLYNRPVHYNNGWDAPEELRLIMAFDSRRRFIESGEFEKVLIPELLSKELRLIGKESRTSLLMPLFFGDEQLGVVLIEENRSMPVDMYETLRLALSTAVKGAALFTEVKDLSIKDELTELYNRRGLLTLAEQKYSDLQKVNGSATLLFIDLDGLKMINDTYGHTEGDWAIMETARILSQATRRGDVLARLGGDEFVLFATEPGNSGVEEIVKRVRNAFAHFNNEVSKKPYKIECSIGAVISSGSDTRSFNELLNSADSQLYKEKEKKKGAR